MNDPFERKVRAAAVAGWWVVLIDFDMLEARNDSTQKAQ